MSAPREGGALHLYGVPWSAMGTRERIGYVVLLAAQYLVVAIVLAVMVAFLIWAWGPGRGCMPDTICS